MFQSECQFETSVLTNGDDFSMRRFDFSHSNAQPSALQKPLKSAKHRFKLAEKFCKNFPPLKEIKQQVI